MYKFIQGERIESNKSIAASLAVSYLNGTPDVYNFFQAVKPTFLAPEAAVGYVVSVLLKGDFYGTELIQQVEKEYPGYCLSDMVLYQAIKFLKSEKWIKCYPQKLEGRGRPHRMLSLNPDVREEAQKLAQMWREFSASTLL